ncbi:hypothetical protein KA531_00050 [Candidatus Saccharibacteria bacterium]|nr:hypothetical protein [Candidatus Saccharibacteria bacterium]
MRRKYQSHRRNYFKPSDRAIKRSQTAKYLSDRKRKLHLADQVVTITLAILAILIIQFLSYKMLSPTERLLIRLLGR